jgi:ferredoxin-fold anticodon binding domain-containing protein
MNIEDLTIKQARELAALFSGVTAAPSAHPFIGKYCIARCYSAGVHAGVVVSVEGENVTLKDSVRLWSWRATEGLALSGVAQNGLDKSMSKLDVVNPEIFLTGVCELIPCTQKARESIHA